MLDNFPERPLAQLNETAEASIRKFFEIGSKDKWAFFF
jgi:hypothetical protein